MTDRLTQPLTYGAYLRVPELIDLQTPLGRPEVHDEMLFIIVQQAQELWFKQVLYELRSIIDLLERGDLSGGTRLLERVNRILRVLSNELEVLETLPSVEFQRFRHVLTPSSGFESKQFRELELASGLRDESFLRMAGKILDLNDFRARWPLTLHDALLHVLASIEADPDRALAGVYLSPDATPQIYRLTEALTEYEILFSAWRFHHIKLVERVIGDRAPGTGGSAGSGYLSKTLGYRFFPELWEVRNYLSARAASNEL